MTAVPEVLGRARQLVTPILKTAVDSLTDEMRLPAAYHFGWMDREGNPIPDGGGKGIRPALAVLSAEAAGAAGEVGALGGAAVELIHNFSLVHDDIIDDDTERRHQPTVWAAWSVGDAVIVGDALHTLAFELLLDETTPERVAAAQRLARGTSAMIAGQSDDMSFDRRPQVTLADCLEMEARKTGALLSFAASVGAVLAGAPAATVEVLETYGHHLGIAFQAVDDVLGIWGDPSVTGKAAGNDLRERKRSMPVAAVLEGGGETAIQLAAMYTGTDTEFSVEKLADMIADAGGRSITEQIAADHLGLALEAASSDHLQKAAAAELATVAQFVVDRSF